MRIQLYKNRQRRPSELDKNKIGERFKRIGSMYQVSFRSYNCRLVNFKCYNCGTEVYAVWQPAGSWNFRDIRPSLVGIAPNVKMEEDRIIADTNRNAYEWDKACKEEEQTLTDNGIICPICGKQLSHHHTVFYDPECGNEDFQINYAFNELEDWREREFANKARFKIMSFLNSANSSSSYPEASGDTHKDSAGFDLKKYILDLIHLETGILSLQKHLNDLYQMQFKNEDEVCIIDHAPLIDVYYKKQEMEKKIKKQETAYTVCCSQFSRIKRNRPAEATLTLPSKPAEPQMKKPGLFNKKKVLAANELLMQDYQQRMDAYNAEVERAKEEKRQQDIKIQTTYQRDIEEAQKRCDQAKLLLNNLKKTPISSKNPVQVCPEKATRQYLQDEIGKNEALLKNLIDCRNRMYALNIVFSKYRDLVPLSSFYEYLISGRCVALEGPDGAYNLYESECRANLIISKLSEIVESLNRIEKNQYMLYEQLTEMNSKLDDLRESMDAAAESVQKIKANTDSMDKYMDKIAKNSDVMAHNAAVSAYYSKLNAELTDALGFMTALN